MNLPIASGLPTQNKPLTSVRALKFLQIAKAVALLSKDNSTQVGCVILGPGHEIRSVGYNGAPRGCSADEDERGTTRPEKYFWYSHSELNAITNAARVGTPLLGSSLVVTHFPCMDCARAIVQAGIVEVFCPAPDGVFEERWREHLGRAVQLFNETNVKVTWL
jgi:dCMP deaminase